MTDTDVREHAAQAASTGTFGRVLCSARNHHFVVDGPEQQHNTDSLHWRLSSGEFTLSGLTR